MSTAQTLAPARRKPLRLWPGVMAVLLLLFARFGLKVIIPGFGGFRLGMMWTFAAAAVVLLWWLLLSRARWFDRLGAVALMAGGLFAAWQLRHESMGPAWLMAYALPGLFVAFIVGLLATRRLADGPRRAVVAAVILIACGAWLLVRTEGIDGDHDATFGWRWAKSPEEQLVAREPVPQPVVPRAAPASAVEPSKQPEPTEASKPLAPTPRIEAAVSKDWPEFRGPRRDGIVRGVRIDTDWSESPPRQLWRRAIGPGWSSFAVSGDFFYTQEQRGDHEVVACYRLSTGEPVWAHRDAARFFESNAGAGPRATPTLSNGRVYTFGATGILNALDASSGAVVWTRDAAGDSEGVPTMGGKSKIPDWGFASSPLVVDDLVIVAVAGQLNGYDRDTGKPRWMGTNGGVSYSSPHLVTIGGVPQVLLLSAAGATAVAPADGKRLWEHPWRGHPIVQPALTADGDVLIVASGESGTRRIAVTNGGGGWTAAERWTSKALKPYFNDLVVHEGHAYGFDARILACIDLKDGSRKWKGGRYGNGQLVLLPEQDVLLVLSEEGELALVRAMPDQFTELARFKAIEGKTWNHPVLAGDVLLVRNGEEMAAFRVPMAGR